VYHNHQKTIERYARQSPEHFARILQFVILTVRVPLYRVRQDTSTAAQGGADALGVLWGWKHNAYNAAQDGAENSLAYLEHCQAHYGDERERAQAMLEHVADLPGFGLAKAGFVLQLAFGLAGCLDTHNLSRFNISASTFKDFKARSTKKARERLSQKYIDAVYALGGPSTLWDSWCEYVATNQASTYDDAEHVSRLHCEALDLT
jgi:hypothetical protein|tara:strand:+ start:808 stop:1422 length:615 start_codon:yes stop_codon:yes gene_type:complete